MTHLAVHYSSLTRIIITVFLFLVLVVHASRASNTYQTESVKGTQASQIQLSSGEIPIRNSNIEEPQFAARHVLSIDANSGRVLYSKNAEESVPIASLTKVMTAIVALENYRIDDVVTVSKNAASTIGSVILLRPNEQLTAESLLKGLLIQSGNDAAVALAEYIGDQQVFVQLMNTKATLLGATKTRFTDPNGLSDESVSSATDLAKIFRYALTFPVFREIIHIPSTTITSTDGKLSHQLDNSNRLVKEEMFYEGIIGGKTGFTPTAGHNLIVSSERNGHEIITVVMNTHAQTNTASAEVSRDILDWSFENFEWLKL